MEVMQKLRDQRGEVALHLSFLLIGFVLLLSLGMGVYRLYHVIDMTKSRANEAVLAVATTNVSGFYGGAREGDGQARRPSEASFQYLVQTDDVLLQLANALGATPTGDNGLSRPGDYSITGLHTHFENYSDGKLNFTTTYRLAVQLAAGGLPLPEITLSLEVHTTYETKF